MTDFDACMHHVKRRKKKDRDAQGVPGVTMRAAVRWVGLGVGRPDPDNLTVGECATWQAFAESIAVAVDPRAAPSAGEA